MKTFILHWLDGSKNVAKGEDIAQAFTLAGFSAGALPALDYYEEVKIEVEVETEDDTEARNQHNLLYGWNA